MKGNFSCIKIDTFILTPGIIVLWILILFLFPGCLTGNSSPDQNPGKELFDFVIPWDDDSKTAINVHQEPISPAGKEGFIIVNADGHLADRKGRVRFWGVNTCFGANFPSHKDAEKIARHMAKFGINIVRFHHMDMFPAPNGIWESTSPDRILDNKQLDKLDYFIFQLKQNGIYADLNLLVSRPFHRGTELHPDIEKVKDWKDRAVIGMFDEDIIKLQKRYAKDLLTHKNPYTGQTYTEDPALAFIEINNENGLIHAYLNGQLDDLPGYYKEELETLWNNWLKKRYSNQEELEEAWNVTAYSPGNEMLVNGDFTAQKVQPWNLEKHDTARATTELAGKGPGGNPAVKIDITAPGSLSWHIQFNQSGLAIQKNVPYNLKFFAKADKERVITAGIAMAHSPWQGLGFQANVSLTKEWQEFVFSPFTLHTTDAASRLNFSNMGLETGAVWLSGVSLKQGGTIGIVPGENLETGTIECFTFQKSRCRTDEGKKDWFRFLMEREESYWTGMRDYIKKECKAQSLVFGTIVGCSTPSLMSGFDVIDSHSYWCHPVFPHQSWDYRDWYVENQCMINFPERATVTGLSMKAVQGFPHAVSEYNHSHPNTFQAETFFLLAAYASLQDWDVLIPFTYSHRTNEWGAGRIPNYFDIDQNPVKLASFIPAAQAFLKYHIQPARKQVSIPFPGDKEIELLLTAHAWKLVDASSKDIDERTGLIHRVRLITDGREPDTHDLEPGDVSVPDRVFESDTKEILWDASKPGKGVFTVNTEKTIFIAGFSANETFRFQGITIQPGNTLQDGFSCIALTLLEGESPGKPSRFLITALGVEDNNHSKWYKYPDTPVPFPPPSGAAVTQKEYYGDPPSRVEGISAQFTLSVNDKAVSVWALDAKGGRQGEVPVARKEGGIRFAIGPEYKAVWYEIVVE
ncbi:MAG: carbohydrate binding domain-containing protein [Spirochaetales bacterium]|nr:carbohydrate binding domain-containing protein [Spirochaetales bacterium]